LFSIRADRVITFEKGLIGFPEAKKFCILEPKEDCAFFWMQSMEDPELAFVVTDPAIFLPHYQVKIESDDLKDIGVKDLSDTQTFVVVNKVEKKMTGNCASPLIINTLNAQGIQILLSTKEWGVRETLLDLGRVKTRV